jgi:RNA polymerase sigma-70 factor (ECF subfamily)
MSSESFRAPNLNSPDLIQASDAEVLAAMATGQREALGILYDRYAPLVYAIALKVLTHPEDAEDLTHEIFLTLYRRNTYDPQRGSLNSFLTTLTRSRALDKLRSRGSKHRLLQRWKQVLLGGAPSPSPLEQADLDDRSQQVKNALAQLSPQERQVLEVAYYEGLSQSELAARFGIPLGTIKTRSRQGLLKLRKILQDDF